MKLRGLLSTSGALLALAGMILAAGWFRIALDAFLQSQTGRLSSALTAHRLVVIGWALLALGLALLALAWPAYPYLKRFLDFLQGFLSQLDNAIQQRLGRWLVFEAPRGARAAAVKAIDAFDLAALASFLVFAAWFCLGRLQGNYPLVFLTSDAANIASFAAAHDHPELFQGDALLGDLDNIRVYSTIHIPLLRFLAPLAGNYGLAVAWMLTPHVFLQLLGFYIFGRLVLGSRYWAYLLAAMTAMPVTLNLGETWGILPDALPRFTFQAALPYLLALTWKWKQVPGRWPWIMAFSGLLIYLHPVSTPAWMLAIWLSLGLFLPDNWPALKRITIMAGLGAVALLVASPFVINYLNYHEQGSSPNYDLVYHVIVTYFPPNLLDVPEGLKDFASVTGPLLPAALVGIVLVWLMARDQRKNIYHMLAWLCGLALVAILVPWVIHTIERYLRLVPFESELLRGIRYFVPFLLLFCLWPLAELGRRLRHPVARRSAEVAGLLLVLLWGSLNPPNPKGLSQAAACLAQGRLVCSTPSQGGLALQAVSELTPPGAKIFTSTAMESETAFGIVVRYLALRPLLFSFKDRGLLVYSNAADLAHWHELYVRMEKLPQAASPDEKLAGLLEIASAEGADYLLLDFTVDPGLLREFQAEAVYQNTVYTLLKLSPATGQR